jgi:hypothetical protein
MQEDRLKSYLETATNIMVLAVSILVLGILAWSYLRPTPKTKFQSGLQIGQRFAPLSGIEFRDYPQTLLVALNSKCTYCSESIPFYKQIINLQYANRFTRIVALSSETEDIIKPYLLNNQINMRL